MTTPTLHDYPDYGRQKAESDIPILFLDNITISAARTDGPIFVGAMPALYLAFLGSATRSRIRCEFYADEALTQLIDTDGVVIPANGYYTGSITVFAPWVKIITEASAYNANVTVRLMMAPLTTAALGINGNAGEILHGQGLSVPGASNSQVVASCAWRGSGSFFFELPAVGSGLVLESLNFAGTARLLYQIFGNGNRDVVQLGLPCNVLRLTLHNFDAAAQNFNFSLQGLRQSGR